MSELEFFEDGFDHSQMLGGLKQAVSNYEALVETVGEEAMARPDGLTDEELKLAISINRDVFVPDALKIPEDTAAIMATEGFRRLEPHYIEAQYAMDNFVGRAVAQNLFAVVNTAEARAILPHQTVALFEVNANRGFSRGREDSAGCYGLPLDWLGYAVIDLNYEGKEGLESRSYMHDRTDYLGEPRSWTTDGEGLERNAARVRIRPAHPIKGSFAHFPSPRDIYEKRVGLSDKDTHIYNEWSVLSGEYRICRAVCVLHDLTDWSVDDFKSRDELYELWRESQIKQISGE